MKKCAGCGKMYRIADNEMGWRIDTMAGTYYYCSLDCLEKRID